MGGGGDRYTLVSFTHNFFDIGPAVFNGAPDLG
jgi:hypothetical protein